jgi:type I restriction enzyme, S subunit
MNTSRASAIDSEQQGEIEIREFPKGWSLTPMGRLVQKTEQIDIRKSNALFKYIDVSGIDKIHSRIADWSVYRGQDAPSRARKIVRKNDVIVATVRPTLKRIAKVTDELDNYICSTAFCVLRPDQGVVDSSYLYYAVQTHNFIKSLGTLQRGASYPAVTDADVKRQKIPLPPLKEQKTIAFVLSSIQQIRERTESAIGAYKELKKALMKHLFKYGPVSIGDSEKVRLRSTDFGEVPNEWASVHLRDCANVQTGVAKGRRFNDQRTVSLAYLRVANVQDGKLDLTEMKKLQLRENEVPRYLLQDGDIVLTEGGDFDKLGRGFIWRGEVNPCVHQNHIFAVRVDRGKLLPEFVAYLVQSQYGKAYFLSVAHKTTNLACINTAKLKAFPVLIPTLAVQTKIASIFSAVDDKIEKLESKKRALDELFRSMLENLMTARIRVNDLEVGDE